MNSIGRTTSGAGIARSIPTNSMGGLADCFPCEICCPAPSYWNFERSIVPSVSTAYGENTSPTVYCRRIIVIANTFYSEKGGIGEYNLDMASHESPYDGVSRLMSQTVFAPRSFCSADPPVPPSEPFKNSCWDIHDATIANAKPPNRPCPIKWVPGGNKSFDLNGKTLYRAAIGGGCGIGPMVPHDVFLTCFHWVLTYGKSSRRVITHLDTFIEPIFYWRETRHGPNCAIVRQG